MKTSALIALLITGAAAGFIAGHYWPSSKPAQASQLLYYVDPMHPTYRSSKPGTAPDCGMDLVPVYAHDIRESLPLSDRLPDRSVHIDRVAQRLYGIQLSRVEKANGVRTIRAFGKVVPDETQVFRVDLGTDGYVKTTTADAIGMHVKKDQHLALVYSPDFLSVAGGYLSANERSPGVSGKDAIGGTQNAASAQARADRLRNLGMSDVQIEEISASRKIPEDIYVVSPVDGFILTRNISPGLRFERNTDLYTIADLRHVWIVAEVFGADANAFHAGAAVRITLADTHEEFKARVSNILPEADPITHSMKVKIETDNPDFKLRPEMLVNVELDAVSPPGLSVPSSAILDSGVTKRVFVESTQGNFTPREVQLGMRSGDSVQVLKGLDEGEHVATAGTFLIDSESRIQTTSHQVNVSGGRVGNAGEVAVGLPRAETNP